MVGRTGNQRGEQLSASPTRLPSHRSFAGVHRRTHLQLHHLVVAGQIDIVGYDGFGSLKKTAAKQTFAFRIAI
ncbi:MAG: hypothetical protein U9P12_02155 [Verrucomicrobiota bacterium]|nr:hypothetical protein [Verrucomicrobiota bacterium]